MYMSAPKLILWLSPWFHSSGRRSRVSVVSMAGSVIALDDTSASDSILSIKERILDYNPKLYVSRQRLMYRPGPHGINPLADDETLGGAGVAQDGSAEIDLLLAELTDVETAERGQQARVAATVTDGALTWFRFLCDFLHSRSLRCQSTLLRRDAFTLTISPASANIHCSSLLSNEISC